VEAAQASLLEQEPASSNKRMERIRRKRGRLEHQSMKVTTSNLLETCGVMQRCTMKTQFECDEGKVTLLGLVR
jgi:hypothetical protein